MNTGIGEPEYALVATVVNHPDLLDDVDVEYTDFFDNQLGLVYRTVRHLESTGAEVSLITVVDKLKNRLPQQVLTDACDYIRARPQSIKELSRIVKTNSVRRKLAEIGKKCIDLSRDADDVNAAMADVERELATVSELTASRKTMVKLSDVLGDHLDRIESRYANRGEITGVPSGLVDLDAITGGAQPNDFMVIAARPSMGKTAFMLHHAYEATRYGAAGIFSLEMATEQLVDRLVASHGPVSLHGVRTGMLGEDDWPKLSTAFTKLSDIPMWIDDKTDVDMNDIRRGVREIRKQIGPEMPLVIYLDYLQLVQEKGRSRNEELGEISRRCKAIAKEFKCTFIALAQLSRTVESRQNKRPMLSDIRESGNIEQDADIVAFLYRDDYYNPETEHKNITEVIVAKNRNGPTATAQTVFLKQFQTFVNLRRE